MNKKERKKWIPIIEKCLKQDEYGDMRICELCKYINNQSFFGKKGLKRCKKCICYDYMLFLGTSKELTLLAPCEHIVNSTLKEGINHEFKLEAHKISVRNHLRKMLAWIKK